MGSAAATSHLIPLRSQQASTRAAFFIAGFALSAWAPLIPFAKDRAGLDEATLGLLLLCFGAGTVTTTSQYLPSVGESAERIALGHIGVR